MKTDPGAIEGAVDYILIARRLERIADHATNIAEDVIFMVKGIDVRHQMLEQD
jgi:phosphate transport system protein